MKKRIFLQGSLVIGGVALAIVFHDYFFPHWSSPIWERWLDLLGITLVLNGFLIRVLARGYKSLRSAQSHALVNQGIYRLMRNPMYLGSFLIGIGGILVVFQWWLMFIFIAGFFAIYIPEMRKEEKFLLEHFGEEYRQYCLATPKFIPRLTSIFSEDFRREFVFDRKWFRSEISAMIWTVGLIMVIEMWEDTTLFGEKIASLDFLELVLAIVLTGIIWIVVARCFQKRV